MNFSKYALSAALIVFTGPALAADQALEPLDGLYCDSWKDADAFASMLRDAPSLQIDTEEHFESAIDNLLTKTSCRPAEIDGSRAAEIHERHRYDGVKFAVLAEGSGYVVVMDFTSDAWGHTYGSAD